MKPILLTLLSLIVLTAQAQVFWEEQNNTPGESAIFFDFVTEDLVFASFDQVGSQETVIRKTIDNGLNWTLIPHAIDSAQFMAFDAVNDSTIYACYRQFGSPIVNVSKIFRTSDGGGSWSDLTPDTTETGYGWTSIEFTSDSVGYWAVAERMYRTADAGLSWTTIILPFGHNAISMDFQDDSTGIIGTWDGTFGYHGGLLLTTDGGQTWADTAFLSENYTTMASVRMDGIGKAYGSTAGYNPYQNHILFISNDLGKNWQRLPIPDTLSDYKLVSFDIQNGRGYIVEESMGHSYLYLTNDGGYTWSFEKTINGIDLWHMNVYEKRGFLGGASNRIFYLDRTTGLSDFQDAISLVISPNPASETIRISSDTKGYSQIKMYNMTGQFIWEREYFSEMVIPVHDLAQGIYIIELRTESSYGRSLFVKQ